MYAARRFGKHKTAHVTCCAQITGLTVLVMPAAGRGAAGTDSQMLESIVLGSAAECTMRRSPGAVMPAARRLVNQLTFMAEMQHGCVVTKHADK
jgi:hypothetical protein